MPKTALDVPCTLEHLSILDEDGNLDSELEPDIPDEKLLAMHRAMLTSRRLDERMLSLQSQGRLGTFAPAKGQEAAQVGSAAALGEQDWVVPSYRETAVAVWRGADLASMLMHNAGYTEGGATEEGARDLPVSVPVGTQMLHAAGLAYGLKLQDREDIVMTYFGDGATSQGDFHEAMNFAMVYACPVIFLCQNNQYAISVPRSKQTSSQTLAQKAFAYDMPCIQVDGNDVLAVYAAADEAAARARREATPTLIECVTYRLSVHTTVDDPSKYRDEAEVKEWGKRDPIPRFQKYLKAAGVLSDSDLKELEAEIEKQLDEVVATAEGKEREDDTKAVFGHLLDEAPKYVRSQRRAFEAQQSRGADG